MNKLVKIQRTEISPWRAHADETMASAIAGDILRFIKGRWYRGEEKKLVESEVQFLCNMNEVWTGWVRWFNARPVEHRIHRLIDGAPKLSRNDLGHLDESVWETDAAGEPKDPWAYTERMIMREVGTDELLTFSTSSWGGLKALGKLCRAFDDGRAKHPGMFPVVQLEAVIRPSKDYGPIDEPLFEIVSWAPWDDSTPPPIEETADDPRTQVRDALDQDEIPFSRWMRGLSQQPSVASGRALMGSPAAPCIMTRHQA